MLNLKSTIIPFSSIKAQLYMIIGLLAIVFALIILNLYADQFVKKTVQFHSKMVELESRFLRLVSKESTSFQEEKQFTTMMEEYSGLSSACLVCHHKKFDFLTSREGILMAFYRSQKESGALYSEVLSRIDSLLVSVREVYDFHISSLADSRKESNEAEGSHLDAAQTEKLTPTVLSDLNRIKQVVLIQQAIIDLSTDFYALNRGADFQDVKNSFNENISRYQEAVRKFEEYALDVKDGPFVEKLNENGRLFPQSLKMLIDLIGKRRQLREKLGENQETVLANLFRGEHTLQGNLGQLNRRINFLKWSTIVIVLSLFLVSLVKSRGIVQSITGIVRETEKIEKDFRYRIKEDPSITGEFRVLIHALNSMAIKIGIRVKRLHAEIKQRMLAEEKLSAEKERLAVTLKSIGDGVITTDTQGNVVLINKVAEELTGWSSEEAVGKPVGTVFSIFCEETGEPCSSPVEEVIRRGTIIDMTDQMMLVAKDGTRYSISDSGAPIRDSDNQMIGVVLVFRDMSERLRMEKEWLKMKNLESLGLLAGGIAHDFNNILLAILGNIRLADRYVDKDNIASELLAEAGRAATRAQGLTQQLLTFSRGGHPIKKTASIDKLIKESARFILRGSPIGCKFHFDDDLWLTNIDEGQMSQVIQNVTLNGASAMDEGEIVISCENVADIKTETSIGVDGKEFVKITIADKGKGISPKDLEKIFDPYFSTKEEGSGLGLAVSHSIVTKHGGLILVESELNHGTVVTIYVPAIRDQLLEQEEGVEIRTDCSGKILVMDDDQMVLLTTGKVLRYMGYDVVLTSDGKEAIEEYRESYSSDYPVDLIIMDLTIPGGMGGKDAIREIFKINPEAKVVVSSGYSNDHVLANFREYGFRGVIVKPYDLTDISRVLREVM